MQLEVILSATLDVSLSVPEIVTVVFVPTKLKIIIMHITCMY